MNDKDKLRFESLEHRLCLTVSVSVSDGGDLHVEGEADGPVVITATDDQSFSVTDDGVSLGTFNNVTNDIRVDLDRTGSSSDDTVTLNLSGATVDKVYAKLGNGENSLEVNEGTITKSLIFRGGNGDDSLSVSSEVQKAVYAAMGQGDNMTTINGKCAESMP